MTVLDDDVTPTDGKPQTIRDFEGDVPIGAPPGPGLFTFGGDADDHPRLTSCRSSPVPARRPATTC